MIKTSLLCVLCVLCGKRNKKDVAQLRFLGLVSDLAALGRKAPRERVVELMVRLCSCRAMTKDDLVKYLKRSDATVKHIAASLVGTRLSYLYPEVIHHPNQAYVAMESEGE